MVLGAAVPLHSPVTMPSGASSSRPNGASCSVGANQLGELSSSFTLITAPKLSSLQRRMGAPESFS